MQWTFKNDYTPNAMDIQKKNPYWTLKNDYTPNTMII